MKVGVAKETAPGERRVALVPETLGKLKSAGLDILVERGAGAGSAIPDQAFTDAGATVVSTDDLYAQSDVILRVAKPSEAEIARTRQGQAVIGLLQPLIDPKSAAALAAQRRDGDLAGRPAPHAEPRPDDGRAVLARPTSAATRPCSSRPTPTAATSRC